MGWKGNVRTGVSLIRAADRASQRRQKELAKQRKAYEKMALLEQDSYEFDVYQNLIDMLISVHKEVRPPVDWSHVTSQLPPQKPTIGNSTSTEAKSRYENFKPNLIHKLFKQESKTRDKLKNKYKKAVSKEKGDYDELLEKWTIDTQLFLDSIRVARGVLADDPEIKLEALEGLDLFADIDELGSSVEIKYDEKILHLTLTVHGNEIIPKEEKRLLASGRLSTKKMPVGKFNELYQDYICSCLIRLANEVFAALKDDKVIVTAKDQILNKATGNLEIVPIVSALIPRNTWSGLNLEKIDCSDAMSNFVHNMDFKKLKGFSAVDELMPSQFTENAGSDTI